MGNPASGYEWDLSPDGAPKGLANWDAICNAIQAQVVAASGLDPQKVIWEKQGRDRPAGSFIGLSLAGNITSEAPNTPEQIVTDNPASNGHDGIEILLTSSEPVNFPIRINFYKGANAGGSMSAWARLSTILRFLAAESVTDELAASNVSLIECGTVSDISVALETEYEGRALADLQFATIDGFAEATTYIETVDVTTTIKRPDGSTLP